MDYNTVAKRALDESFYDKPSSLGLENSVRERLRKNVNAMFKTNQRIPENRAKFEAAKSAFDRYNSITANRPTDFGGMKSFGRLNSLEAYKAPRLDVAKDKAAWRAAEVPNRDFTGRQIDRNNITSTLLRRERQGKLNMDNLPGFKSHK